MHTKVLLKNRVRKNKMRKEEVTILSARLVVCDRTTSLLRMWHAHIKKLATEALMSHFTNPPLPL